MAQPSEEAPLLPGLTVVRRLGSGGFADVFLYQQARTARQVAVKVLRARGGRGADHSRFDDEANLMAQVSAHPYIVTIFSADVAEDGRPYLVMEYYPGSDFGEYVRPSWDPDVDWVLRSGIQIASAVETAHRAGIIHRDIKPANILTSEYGRPGLTDFGIAGAHEGGARGTRGVSIPYAPREVLEELTPGDAQSDVYSLAATVYALLAGRTPFEVPGGDNSSEAIVARALTTPVPPTGRAAVPPSLERLLTHAMAKRPEHRPASAFEFARGLQTIEIERGLTPTEIEARFDRGPAPVISQEPRDDDDRTRVASVKVVRPTPGPPAWSPPPAAPPSDVLSAVSSMPDRASGADATSGDTIARATPKEEPAESSLDAPRRSRLVAYWAGAAVLAIALVLAVSLGGRDGGDDERNETGRPRATQPDIAFVEAPVPPVDVIVTRTPEGIVVTWTPATEDKEDRFRVTRIDSGLPPRPPDEVDAPPYTLKDVAADESPCFQVSTVRGDQISEPSPLVCATAAAPVDPGAAP